MEEVEAHDLDYQSNCIDLLDKVRNFLDTIYESEEFNGNDNIQRETLIIKNALQKVQLTTNEDDQVNEFFDAEDFETVPSTDGSTEYEDAEDFEVFEGEKLRQLIDPYGEGIEKKVFWVRFGRTNEEIAAGALPIPKQPEDKFRLSKKQGLVEGDLVDNTEMVKTYSPGEKRRKITYPIKPRSRNINESAESRKDEGDCVIPNLTKQQTLYQNCQSAPTTENKINSKDEKNQFENINDFIGPSLSYNRSEISDILDCKLLKSWKTHSSTDFKEINLLDQSINSENKWNISIPVGLLEEQKTIPPPNPPLLAWPVKEEVNFIQDKLFLSNDSVKSSGLNKENTKFIAENERRDSKSYTTPKYDTTPLMKVDSKSLTKGNCKLNFTTKCTGKISAIEIAKSPFKKKQSPVVVSGNKKKENVTAKSTETLREKKAKTNKMLKERFKNMNVKETERRPATAVSSNISQDKHSRSSGETSLFVGKRRLTSADHVGEKKITLSSSKMFRKKTERFSEYKLNRKHKSDDDGSDLIMSDHSRRSENTRKNNRNMKCKYSINKRFNSGFSPNHRTPSRANSNGSYSLRDSYDDWEETGDSDRSPHRTSFKQRERTKHPRSGGKRESTTTSNSNSGRSRGYFRDYKKRLNSTSSTRRGPKCISSTSSSSSAGSYQRVTKRNLNSRNNGQRDKKSESSASPTRNRTSQRNVNLMARPRNENFNKRRSSSRRIEQKEKFSSFIPASLAESSESLIKKRSLASLKKNIRNKLRNVSIKKRKGGTVRTEKTQPTSGRRGSGAVHGKEPTRSVTCPQNKTNVQTPPNKRHWY